MFFGGVVQASAGNTSIAPLYKTHDLSHPAHVTLPCPGAPRSGLGTQAVITCEAGSLQGKSGVTPYANDPRGMCVNGVGYRQGENGAYGWTTTQQGLKVYVEYWWCPVTSAYQSQYPNGANWSYGTVRSTSSCVTVRVGSWKGTGSTNETELGAVLVRQYGVPVSDGEDNVPYQVCAGDPNSYVWDYSQPGDGRNAWKAKMSSGVQGTVNGIITLTQHAEVYSPNYQ